MSDHDDYMAALFAGAILSQSAEMRAEAIARAKILHEMIRTHRSAFLAASAHAFETRSEADLVRASAEIRHVADVIDGIAAEIKRARQPIGEMLEAAE